MGGYLFCVEIECGGSVSRSTQLDFSMSEALCCIIVVDFFCEYGNSSKSLLMLSSRPVLQNIWPQYIPARPAPRSCLTRLGFTRVQRAEATDRLRAGQRWRRRQRFRRRPCCRWIREFSCCFVPLIILYHPLAILFAISLVFYFLSFWVCSINLKPLFDLVSQGQRLPSPDIPPLRDFRELCDGVCLAYLISYYCPKLVPWPSVHFNHVPTIEVSPQYAWRSILMPLCLRSQGPNN